MVFGRLEFNVGRCVYKLVELVSVESYPSSIEHQTTITLDVNVERLSVESIFKHRTSNDNYFGR